MTRDARNEREAHAMLQQHVRDTSGEPLMGSEPWVDLDGVIRLAWFLLGIAWGVVVMGLARCAQ